MRLPVIATVALLAASPAFAQQPPAAPAATLDPLSEAVSDTTREITMELIQWRTRALQDEKEIGSLNKQIADLKEAASKHEQPPSPPPHPATPATKAP